MNDPVADRTSSYDTASSALAKLAAEGADFEQLETELLRYTELRGDEREALWLYGWGLIARRQRG